MSECPELFSDQCFLYDRVMLPLAQQPMRKTRKEYCTKKSRHSTSSSSAIDHPSLFHHVDDDNDKAGEDESMDNAFANSTSLKDLVEGYSSKNYVRNFLMALHHKWRAKVMAIEESKDLTSLSLNELIGNLNVYELIIKKDSKIVKGKRERSYLPLKAKNVSSDEESLTFEVKTKNKPWRLETSRSSSREEVGSWSDSGEEDDGKANDKTYLMTQASSEKIIKFRLGGHAYNLTLLEFARRLGLYQAVELKEEGFNVYFEGGLRNDEHFNAQDYWLSISREEKFGLSRSLTSTIRSLILRVIHKMITYGLCQRTTGNLDTITFRNLTDSDSKLIPEDPQLGVPRVGIPRPPRASMYHGVFEHMVGVYSVPLQGAYNLPGYAQPQYDQYYQQYLPSPTQHQQQQDDE
nr:UBN2 domain-containing protein [Tanacetum cinerariifolium]